MSSPNQTGLLALGLDFVHQDFLGILGGLAEMQVSPLSMLQKTLMESLMLPWFGSIQYSPGQKKEFWLYAGPKDSSTPKKKLKNLTALLLRVALLNVLAGFGRVRLAAVWIAEV